MIAKTGYRIASFNIEKFGDKSVEFRNGRAGRKDLDTIAKIIAENEIDIIAIQEITSPFALKSLIEKLSAQPTQPIKLANNGQAAETYAIKTKSWEGRWAKPRSIYSDRAAEGYAFLWNTKKIQLVFNYKNEPFEPRIGYRTKKGDLVRPPFVGRFKPVNGYFEMRLINTHIAWDAPKNVKNPSDEQYMTVMRHKALRENELRKLLDVVYISFDKKHFDVEGKDTFAKPLPAYTFLLGDFNLNLPGIGQDAKMDESLACYQKDIADISSETSTRCIKIITVNQELTTLKDTPTDPQKASAFQRDPIATNHLANNYDHFSYDYERIRKAEISDPRDNVIYAFDYYADAETENQSKFDLYREKISDHLPIILDIDIREKRKR